MATPFHVELVTPERVLYSGEADDISTRTEGGEIAFFAHHADFVGAIDAATVRIHVPGGGAHDQASADTGGDELRFAVFAGFVHVVDDGVRILASVAEPAGEIDVERARAALAAAEERLSTGEGRTEDHGDEAEATPLNTMVVFFAPTSAEAEARQAQVRLDAAGALSTV